MISNSDSNSKTGVSFRGMHPSALTAQSLASANKPAVACCGVQTASGQARPWFYWGQPHALLLSSPPLSLTAAVSCPVGCLSRPTPGHSPAAWHLPAASAASRRGWDYWLSTACWRSKSCSLVSRLSFKREAGQPQASAPETCQGKTAALLPAGPTRPLSAPKRSCV